MQLNNVLTLEDGRLFIFVKHMICVCKTSLYVIVYVTLYVKQVYTIKRNMRMSPNLWFRCSPLSARGSCRRSLSFSPLLCLIVWWPSSLTCPPAERWWFCGVPDQHCKRDATLPFLPFCSAASQRYYAFFVTHSTSCWKSPSGLTVLLNSGTRLKLKLSVSVEQGLSTVAVMGDRSLF